MDAQFDEELIHLTQIGGVAVGVEQGGGSHGVADIESHDLGSPASGKLQDFHVLAMGEGAEEEESGEVVGEELVGWRIGREEGEFSRH